MRKRVLLCLLPWLFAAVGPATAKDELPPLSEQAAVLIQVYGQDPAPERLRSFVEDESVPPFVLVHELVVHGRVDVARAYAGASEREDVRRVQAYLKDIVRRPPSARWWKLRCDAYALLRRGRWSEARKLLKNVDLEDAPSDVATACLLYAKGEADRNLEDPRAGTAHLLRAGEVARGIGWWSGAVEQYEEARSAARQAHDLGGQLRALEGLAGAYELLGDEEQYAYAQVEIGCVYGNLGQYQQAKMQFARVFDQYADVLDAKDLVRCRVLSALAHMRVGELAEAYGLLDAAEAAANELDDADLQALVDQHLGILSLEVGELDDAEKRLGRALKRFLETKDWASAAETTGELGNVYWRRGNLDEAAKWWGKCRDRYRMAGDRLGAARARIGQAAVKRREGKLREALDDLEDVRHVFGDLGDATLLCDVLDQLALVYRAQGKLPLVLETRTKHLEEAVRTGSVRDQVRAGSDLAWVHWTREEYRVAVRCAREATRYLGTIFDRLPPNQAALARERAAPVYEIGLAAAVALGDADDVWYFLERGRAGALLTALEGQEALRTVTVPPVLRERELRTRTAEALALEELALARAADDMDATRAARMRLEDAREAYRAVVRQIQLAGGLAADILYPRAADRADIQASLAPGEVMVSYGRSFEDGLVALVLGHDTEQIVDLGSAGKVDDLVAEVLAAVGSKTADPHPERMRQVLVERLKLPADVDRVLLSPVGRIAYVPPALLFPDVPVVSVPSGSTSARLAVDPSPHHGAVLAIGDPDYEHQVVVHGVPRGMPGTRGGHFRRLENTRYEAKAVGTTVLLGKQATETRVRDALAEAKRWRSVHFACHGYVNEDRPSYCSLVLTPSKKDDGYLKALDVFRMHLDADLAVLSACETGLGRLVKAEGIVGLTSAFLVAGAPQVLVSLWQVEDESTKELMTEFYRLWNPPKERGDTPVPASVALRLAQKHVRELVDEKTKKKKWAHPYYWAGWALWGAAD